MYIHRRKKTGPGSIMFIALFLLASIALAYLMYTDKGIFWDYLPLVSMVVVVLSLAFAVFNFVRRNAVGFVFIIFFIVFLGGIVLSSIFGPFAINLRAQNYYEDGLYAEAIHEYQKIEENYPSSRFYENALVNLPFAYYQNNDCGQTLNYLNKAQELELISPTLEVKNMYIDCHLKLANRYTGESNYRMAAVNYLEALDFYHSIQNEFPGSDLAFLAEHRVPEITFLAATAFRKVPDWDKSIQLFNEVLEKYPSSDYAEKSAELLFASHINRAIELKNNSEYEQAIKEFLNVIEIFKNPQDSFRIAHYRKVILSDIPKFYLDNMAHEFFRENDYKKAAYMYQAIIEYNPGSAQDYVSSLSQSKINYTKTISYRNLDADGDPVRINIPETSVLEIINESIYGAYLYVVGPEDNMLAVSSQSQADIELIPGSYQAVLEFEKEQSIPFFSNLLLEEMYLYRIIVN